MRKSLGNTWWFVVLSWVPNILATTRYYSSYTSYGTGDTVIQLFHNHGGNIYPHRKWIAECFDGEAVTGIQDGNDDYQRLTQLFCRFTFGNKPPTQGAYPYYPSCHVRNMSDQYFCFDPQNAARTINTVMTAVWDNEAVWQLFRQTPGGPDRGTDLLQLYKCCKTPPGYYVDYLTCYYLPTHDAYFEYYDSTFHNMIYCQNGFVMTGWAKKVNPTDKEWHLEWIQCCRVGYGPAAAGAPPSINAQSGMPSYGGSPRAIPEGYRHRYRRVSDDDSHQSLLETHSDLEDHSTYRNLSWSPSVSRTAATESMRYKREPIPLIYSSRNSGSGMHSSNRPIGCESSHV